VNARGHADRHRKVIDPDVGAAAWIPGFAGPPA
jgi:hypothetical protein